MPSPIPRTCCARRHGLDSVAGVEAVELAGVHEASRAIVGLACHRCRPRSSVLPPSRLDDDRDRQVVLPRELEVALIVSRHAHHGARAVLAEHEVRDPDRHRPIGERIDRRPPRVEAFFLDLACHARRAVLRLKSLERLAEVRVPTFLLHFWTSACSGASIRKLAP